MTGSGKVVSQSIAEGDKQAKGKTIRITYAMKVRSDACFPKIKSTASYISQA